MTLCNSMDYTRLLCPWNVPGKNTRVGCRSLLQGYFWPGDQRQVSSCIAGRFFTIWATREAPWLCHRCSLFFSSFSAYVHFCTLVRDSHCHYFYVLYKKPFTVFHSWQSILKCLISFFSLCELWVVSVVQSLSRVQFSACQAPLSSTIYQSLLKFTSFKSVMLMISSSVTPFSFCFQSLHITLINKGYTVIMVESTCSIKFFWMLFGFLYMDCLNKWCFNFYYTCFSLLGLP